MRTKEEVRTFLENQVGKKCVDKSNSKLNGQCVCLIKNLFEFLGVPNPYAARGHAKDVGDAYIRQGIGTAGRGWLTVCVNRDMAAPYGHVWVDLLKEANYESNGATALRVTKNTRPVSQAQQFINLDKWIGGEDMPKIGKESNWRWRFNRLHRQLVGNWDMSDATFNAIVGQEAWKVVENWSDHPNSNQALADQLLGELARKDKWDQQIYTLQDQVKALSTRPTKAELDAVKKLADDLARSLEKAQAQQSEDTQLLNEAGSWLQKLFNRLFKKG